MFVSHTFWSCVRITFWCFSHSTLWQQTIEHLGIVFCIPYLLFDTSLAWCWVHSVASRLYYGVSGSRRKRVHNHSRKPVGRISIKWDMSYHVFSILLAEIRAVNCSLVKELKCWKKHILNIDNLALYCICQTDRPSKIGIFTYISIDNVE